MLLFFIIVLIISVLILILVFSEIKLIIENLKISKKDFEKNSLEEWNKVNYKCTLGLYFLGKVKLFNVNLNNNKTKEIFETNYIKQKIKNTRKKNIFQNKEQKEKIIKALKYILKKIKINKLNLKIDIDTKNVMFTSYLVAIISTIISYIIKNNTKNYSSKNYYFEVSPKYKNENYIYVNLNSIFSIKIVHIINMFYVIGGKNNERSSNRRFNVNCYGKY